MALEKCSECGKEISTEAPVCLCCGKAAPTAGFVEAAKAEETRLRNAAKEEETRRNVIILIVMAILIVGGAVIYGWLSNAWEQAKLQGEMRRDLYRR